MNILVLNAGSSTLKFALFGPGATEAAGAGQVSWRGAGRPPTLTLRRPGTDAVERPTDAADFQAAVRQALDGLRELGVLRGDDQIRAVGHRVVHGGAEFVQSVRLDARVVAALEKLSELAPLHNPPALEAIRAAGAVLPGVPAVAAFDTAFHATLPPEAFLYPLPYEWYADWGVRRFGFHGISHDYCSGRAAELLGRPREGLRLVVCHLGNGCSATAVRHGRSVATTMGFTPLEGLMMGTRSGSVDPGLLFHLQRARGLTAEQLDQALNHRSGLLGVSGVSSDYRAVDEAARRGDDRARLALDIYALRVREAVGALAVGMGGLDALVFTAGVGENAAGLREHVCAGLGCLGLRLDPARNAAARPDADVAAPDSPGRVLVVHTREDLLIAREVWKVLS